MKLVLFLLQMKGFLKFHRNINRHHLHPNNHQNMVIMVNDPPHHNHNHNHHHQDGWGRAALEDSSVKEEKWRRPTHDDKLATPNHVHHHALTHENKLKQNWNYSQENWRVTDAEYATSWQSAVGAARPHIGIFSPQMYFGAKFFSTWMRVNCGKFSPRFPKNSQNFPKCLHMTIYSPKI